MSAFVIGADTMHRVVRLIVRGGCAANFAGHGTDLGPARNADLIGRALFAMNIEAVTQRYPECKDHPEIMPGWTGCEAMPTTYTFNDNWTPLGRKERIIDYKAAKCLRYQCSEGNVPETALYRELEALLAANAEEIVTNLPEYEAASWG
jgi:hypothetical protein